MYTKLIKAEHFGSIYHSILNKYRHLMLSLHRAYAIMVTQETMLDRNPLRYKEVVIPECLFFMIHSNTKEGPCSLDSLPEMG